MAAARSAGLDNISIDLIFGLPARLGRDWSADLDRALALEPAHVSLYGLTAEPDTPLGRRVSAGREQLADEDSYAAEYLLAVRRMSAAGLCHYEVSNFARPGRASRHNRAYWQLRPYVGVGPGAHSYLPPFRTWNVRDWRAYRDGLRAGAGAEAGREEPGGDDIALERTWLGLRNRDGIPLAELSEAQQALVSGWRAAGLADAGVVVRLTAHGWLVLDRLAVELDARRG
jgi:oxygen-independent coproporphyrinogen-3 oxidase